MTILFDLDGTLTDPKEGIVGCIQHALREMEHAVPPAQSLERFIGPPLHGTFRELLPDPSEAEIERAVAFYRARFEPTGMYENRVYDGVSEALESLQRRGARMFIATGKPRIFAGRIVEHFGLARYFTGVYGCELDGRFLDKGELIDHLLCKESLHPGETVMVGDRRHDVEAARRNDVDTVGVLWGYGSQEELQSAGAGRLLRTPAELTTLLRD